MSTHERHVCAIGVSIWTATQGCGPQVVLCHGGPGIYDHLGPVAAMIEDGATVHRYDQRGCGRSEDLGPCDVRTFVGWSPVRSTTLDMTAGVRHGCAPDVFRI